VEAFEAVLNEMQDFLDPLQAVIATTTITEEMAADEREYAMHIQTRGRVSSPQSLFGTLLSPPRSNQFWLDRVLETLFFKLDSPEVQSPLARLPAPQFNCTDTQQVDFLCPSQTCVCVHSCVQPPVPLASYHGIS
jgi:hypothetical protein